MAIEERCPTKLLDDTPADADEFGGHESVARSIAEVIQTEGGGKAIGLEGGWGSGKSTIVNLTSTILNETRNREHRTVVFDTWAPSGRPTPTYVFGEPHHTDPRFQVGPYPKMGPPTC